MRASVLGYPPCTLQLQIMCYNLCVLAWPFVNMSGARITFVHVSHIPVVSSAFVLCVEALGITHVRDCCVQ